ncbi:aspartate/methionine/tyrosine aminotransferase [Rhizomicrobium palustre]|uniref:Aspartate/methionine/tyrosine aminotransferase n=1 Tax=Rhizomicrobium palustre TaxID=189966 RepID=A0A846MXX8_9PROT|nr:aminotransferase class I/II-fold pyridoxal phosphate-dependent enzyme [Rhizomicrobium palustre]NIK87912.1 aspartate/methionine/tyrosine aminotransferase [Rhizomicrobium palustre]
MLNTQSSDTLFPGRLAQLPQGSFAKLANLLDSEKPGEEPISLAVGDPKGAVPEFVMEAINASAAKFGEYPPINATAEWRQAAAGWLKRRFGAELDPEVQVLPLNGTREGLFLAPFILTPEAKAGQRPAILLPNPFYQCYAAAIYAAGAEPVYVPATEESGFLPDFASLPRSVLARSVAAYICSPSNPEGAVASKAYWQSLFALADEYDFVVFADECYADIYRETPPVGALTVRGAPYARLLSFHSLSKRSGLPGLRSGIVAGSVELMTRFRALRNYAGPQVPAPLIAASVAAWSDEAHVGANRAMYQERFRLAEQCLGHLPGFFLPEGGFFLWLKVGDGEKTALKLWQKSGIRVLPGAYMGREMRPGDPTSNPGHAYIRVALVNDLSTINRALTKIAGQLSCEGP